MKLVKEPLIHFLVIGGVLFLLHGWLNDADSSESTDQKIVVSSRAN